MIDVAVHKLVLDRLGIRSVMFAIGGSMGGMQVLEWAYLNQDGAPFVKNIVPIATSGRHSAWCISWGEAQRQSIYSDPKYNNGHYTQENQPTSGLAAARMAAILTYRSRNSFESRFGRRVVKQKMIKKSEQSMAELQHNEGNSIRFGEEKVVTKEMPDSILQPNSGLSRMSNMPVFSAQSYLRYQGDKFISRFDANCYISITRKLDTHDVSRGRGEYAEALGMLTQNCLVIGIETDGLFTVDEQYELAELIPNAEVVIVQSGEGHDGFLVEFDQMKALLCRFIAQHSPSDLNVGSNLSKIDLDIPRTSMSGEQEADILLW